MIGMLHFAATVADLPDCDEITNGRLYYVEDNNQFLVCKTTGWNVIVIQGADGVDGAMSVKTVQMELKGRMVHKGLLEMMVQMDKTELQVLMD